MRPGRGWNLWSNRCKESMNMKQQFGIVVTKQTILAMAEIKAATDAFDNGDTNVFDALDTITAVIDAYRASVQIKREAA